MAQIVRSKSHLRQKLELAEVERHERRAPLLGFILYDDRASHAVVARFLEEELAWLDALASLNRARVFFFSDKAPAPGAGSSASALPSGTVRVADPQLQNPSLEVATRFGLGPADLPGIVFFTDLDLESPANEGVYWPLDISLFEHGKEHAEERLARVFSMIQSHRNRASNPDELLKLLTASVGETDPIIVVPTRSEPRPQSRFIRLVRFPASLVGIARAAYGE